jgi:hypothetical protein
MSLKKLKIDGGYCTVHIYGTVQYRYTVLYSTGTVYCIWITDDADR